MSVYILTSTSEYSLSLNSLNVLVNYTLTNFAFIRAPLIREVWRGRREQRREMYIYIYMYIMHTVYFSSSFVSRHHGKENNFVAKWLFYVHRAERDLS